MRITKTMQKPTPVTTNGQSSVAYPMTEMMANDASPIHPHEFEVSSSI